MDVSGASGKENGLPRTSELSSLSDALNQEIIKMLQEDGRRPYAEIATALGVSEGTIRNRVNWMKRAGMLRIVAVADPRAINYRADAMLGIRVAPGISPKVVAERLSGFPEVVYVLYVAGRYDLLVELVCDADQDLASFLLSHIHSYSDIASVETMIGLLMFKNQFLLKRTLP